MRARPDLHLKAIYTTFRRVEQPLAAQVKRCLHGRVCLPMEKQGAFIAVEDRLGADIFRIRVGRLLAFKVGERQPLQRDDLLTTEGKTPADDGILFVQQWLNNSTRIQLS